MKTLEIQIKSREQADAEFTNAFKAIQSGRKVTPSKGIYFTSLEAVRALLTDRRLTLLHVIREHSPRSISQLAKVAGRDFKNVHADVMLLKHYGLIQMGEGKKTRKKTAGHPMSVPYQAINIHAVV